MPTDYSIKDIAEKYLSTLIHRTDNDFLKLVGGDALINDPRKGNISGNKEITQFAHDTKVWLEYRNTIVQYLRTTATDKRAACESIIHMKSQGENISLPVGVIVTRDAESKAAVIHVYHTMWPAMFQLSVVSSNDVQFFPVALLP